MAEQFDQILEIIKEQGKENRAALKEFAVASREQTSEITSLITHIKAQGKPEINGRGVSLGNLLTIVGALALLGGFLVATQSGQIDRMLIAMEVDNARERSDAEARAGLIIDSKRHEERLKLVETWQPQHDLRVRGLNSAQWERIRALERNVFGAPGDIP